MSPLLEAIEASPVARERTKVILLTLSGHWSVREGYERLGMKRTRFQDLRRQLLEAAVRALEGGVAGRPRSGPGESKRARALREQVVDLEHTLQLARTHVELFDCGLGEVPRVREALRRAGPSIGRRR
jgi:hypothetical protein